MDNSNNIIFSKNLSFYMMQKGVDRNQLCEALGFKYSTVSEWLSAKKYPRMDKIELLAEFFDIKKSDLIEQKKNSLANNSTESIILNKGETIPIPRIGQVAAGINCYAEDNIEEYIPTDRDILKEGYQYFWLSVIGDSMEPELRENDLVLVREQKVLERECYAVVRIDDEDGVVKRVKVEADKITLTSVNPYYPPREFCKEDMNRISIVGPVLEVKRRFNP